MIDTRLKMVALTAVLSLVGQNFLWSQAIAKEPYFRDSTVKPISGTPLFAQAQAQADSACSSFGYTFGFFNGVQTTPRQAEIAKEYLSQIYGANAPNGELIKYEVFYNYSNGFEDFVETFEQRLSEQDAALRGRMELFFEAIRGDGSYLGRLTGAVAGFADVIIAYSDFVRTRAVTRLLALAASPPTFANYAEQRTRLDGSIVEGRKLLLFAHSQGNLFVNSAYDYAVGKVGAASVKVVHVAPASPILKGGHVLADLDLVINGLRLTGTVPDVTDSIPGYLLRPAGLNGEKDALGHGLLEIYVNPQLSISASVRARVMAALNALVAPVAQAQAGFFTATLTWNGTGDVDLHTYEPNGTHVYYGAASGASGFLDVDNVFANGPEHYFATCDAASLQTGTYQVGVNNYSGADGRIATVQLSSKDGVLLTRQLTLGASRGSAGDNSPTLLFTVSVTKDSQSGRFSLTAQ